jgi:hypothetical protein
MSNDELRTRNLYHRVLRISSLFRYSSFVIRHLILALAFAWSAQAHVGSPDVFFDGLVGPYPARITIRMPQVVPGRAEIAVRLLTNQTAEVSFRPLYSRIAVSNAPPPDIGRLVPGEANLYSGELWLMSFGSYSIEVSIHGAAGEGAVEIPVNSVALRQLPLPRALGGILLVLGAVLVFGGLGIIIGAARDSVLPPGVSPGRRERWKGFRAGAVAAVVFAVALAGGKRWWRAEERAFEANLRAWSSLDLTPEVRVEGSQRILHLALGRKQLDPDYFLPLIPDHGKLLHLFVVGQPGNDSIGHLHPLRTGKQSFEVALPPLPAGEYELFCDLTPEKSALSMTATNLVRLPALPGGFTETASVQSDPDDSWTIAPVATMEEAAGKDAIYHLPSGQQVVWKAHPRLCANQDAGLQFEVRDASGQPVSLEPYMGMMSHAAVLRKDGGVFAHLHPSGNFSMAAQSFFDSKLERERDATRSNEGAMPAGMDHSKMHHHHATGESAFSLPYEFPTQGNYRLWVQFKAGGHVETAVFDASVAED